MPILVVYLLVRARPPLKHGPHFSSTGTYIPQHAIEAARMCIAYMKRSVELNWARQIDPSAALDDRVCVSCMFCACRGTHLLDVASFGAGATPVDCHDRCSSSRDSNQGAKGSARIAVTSRPLNTLGTVDARRSD